MRATQTIRYRATLAALLALSVMPAMAADELPATTPDGLELLSGTKVKAVCAKPSTTLEPCTKVALIDCYVAFRKDWDRDYNRDASMKRRS